MVTERNKLQDSRASVEYVCAEIWAGSVLHRSTMLLTATAHMGSWCKAPANLLGEWMPTESYSTVSRTASDGPGTTLSSVGADIKTSYRLL